jgi:preprotein translocase subunit SecY
MPIRRKSDHKYVSKYIMEIMTICALVIVIVIFMPEIVGLLESVKCF